MIPIKDRILINDAEFGHPMKSYENAEFLNGKDGRTLRILSEYLFPDQYLKKNHIYNTIVVFGSARSLSTVDYKIKMTDLTDKLQRGIDVEKINNEIEKHKRLEFTSKYYDETVRLVEMLTSWVKKLPTQKKFYICTGGGPGMMEAANRGAHNTDSPNIGYNIQLPFEQHPNKYITPELNFEFHYFFMRKFWFMYHAKAMIAMPGGFGTLDELFEMLTLQQTKVISKRIPIILYGEKFWKSLINLEYLAEIGMINHEDLDLFQYCDSPEEAFDFIKKELSTYLNIDTEIND
ncbi:MAG: LOG family protein [Candidatus Kapabacteria bacterium]|nr:LOG family protein [Candidatus Kapabacteria bacterium]